MKIRFQLLSVLFAFGAGASFAADPVSGAYVGGSIGMATTSLSTSGFPVELSTLDKSDQSYSLRVGYRFQKNLAVEASYADLGKIRFGVPSVLSETLKTSAVTVDAVGILPVNEKFSAFGKLGVAQMYYATMDVKGDKVTPHVGIGLSYSVSPAVALRAEYDYFGKAKFSDGPSSLEMQSSQVSLGLDYRF